MKPVYIALVVLGLATGLWAIVACVSHPTSEPEDSVTTARELEIQKAAPSEIPMQPAAHGATPALIGSLRSRNHTIHLYAGRFTIEDSEGKILANLVTEDEFAKLLPGLFGDFKHMYAEGRLIADNHTHGKLPSGWSYTSARTTLERVRIKSDP
jgi:hypothetical protein